MEQLEDLLRDGILNMSDEYIFKITGVDVNDPHGPVAIEGWAKAHGYTVTHVNNTVRFSKINPFSEAVHA
jgi:hypothetical protein